MEFTAEQMKAVAEKVYPDFGWFIQSYHDKGCILPAGWEVLRKTYTGEIIPFKPKLDGTDQEKAQALEVMMHVAAMDGVCKLNCHGGLGYSIDYMVPDGDWQTQFKVKSTRVCPNILTAAICALLEHTGERG